MKEFIRGGQLFAHGFRMARQVIKISFLLSLVVSLSIVSIHIYETGIYQDLYNVSIGFWARSHLWLSHFMPHKSVIYITYYNFDYGRWQRFLATAYLKSFLYKNSYIDLLKYQSLLFKFSISFMSSFLITIAYFVIRGTRKFTRETIRGSRFMTDKQVKKILKRDGKASSINIGGIPLIKNSETQHIMLCGTSGSGKTTWMHHLMPEIRRKKQKAVIVDVVGGFVERYYREGYDILLNPFDKRTAYWTPWADIRGEGSIEAITSAMTSSVSTGSGGSSAFFDTTSAILLKSLLEKLGSEGLTKNQILFEKIANATNAEMEDYLEGTSGKILASPNGKETTMSIRSTLLVKLESLSKIQDRDEEPFSIRSFMESDDDRCLFLSIPKAEHMEALKNLVATWINVSVLSLMNQREDLNKRVWFLIDELPSIGKIPSLTDAVTRIRKYGGSVVATIQNVSQLDKVYGHHDRETLMGNFNTKAIFRATNTSTAEYFSKILGQREHRRMQENISYGAHQMRDGVSLNEMEKIEQVVLPSEIMSLKDLECYIKLPGNYPISKTFVPITRGKVVAKAFESGSLQSTF